MARMLRFDEGGEALRQGSLPATAPRRRARWRFRWGRFVGWPLACLLVIAVIRYVGRFMAGIDPSVSMPKWDFHLDWHTLPQTMRLGMLGTGLIVVVALLRIIRDRFRRQQQ
jgi:hypothetical protein